MHGHGLLMARTARHDAIHDGSIYLVALPEGVQQ